MKIRIYLKITLECGKIIMQYIFNGKRYVLEQTKSRNR